MQLFSRCFDAKVSVASCGHRVVLHAEDAGGKHRQGQLESGGFVCVR